MKQREEEQRRSGLGSESGVGRAVECLKRKFGMGKLPIIAGYIACVSVTFNWFSFKDIRNAQLTHVYFPELQHTLSSYVFQTSNNSRNISVFGNNISVYLYHKRA